MKRAASWCLLSLWIVVGSTPPQAAAPERVTRDGKVMTLAAALEKRGLELKTDPDPSEKQVVILGEDGTLTPLLSDPASRALFVDKRLQNRRAKVEGRRFAGIPYLQVLTYQVEEEGRLQTPEYYCDVCAISSPYPQICPCCQGPMELRMRP